MAAALVVCSVLSYLSIGFITARVVLIGALKSGDVWRLKDGSVDDPMVPIMAGAFWPITLAGGLGYLLYKGIEKALTKETRWEHDNRLAKTRRETAIRCAREARACDLPLTEEQARLLREEAGQ